MSLALGDLSWVLYSAVCRVKRQGNNSSLLHGYLKRLCIIKAEPQAPAVDRTAKKESRLFPIVLLILVWFCASTPSFSVSHLLQKQMGKLQISSFAQ